MTAHAGSTQHPGSQGKHLRCAALLLCFAACASAGDELAVTAVRYWSLSDVTRIAIETNGPFTFRTEKLSNPSRIFFDMKDARPQLSSKGTYLVSIKDPRVKQVRVAETAPLVTRVVLDMEEGQFEIATSQLSVPDRLVIEVRPKGEYSAPAPTLSSTGMRRIPDSGEKPTKPVEKKPPVEPPVIAAKANPGKPPLPLTSPVTAPPPPKKKWEEQRKVEAPTLEAAPTLPEAPVLTAAPNANPAAQPAKRNSNGDRSLTRVLGLKIRRVVLDAGHGGHDPGSTGPGGLVEKDLVLDVTRRLGALIEENMGSEVIYTRSTDVFIPLEERPAIANARKADIFLSIHANSSPIKSVTGLETYYLSFTTSRAAMDLAARENAASERSISDLKDLLQKIALRDKVDESREFAAKVQMSLTKLIPPSPAVKTRQDRGIKKAPLIVLIGASMPSILAEIGFVSNPREETQLKKSEYRQKLAEALYKGLQQYAESLSHFEVAQRQKSDGTE